MGALSSYGNSWRMLFKSPLLLVPALILVLLRLPAFISTAFSLSTSPTQQLLQFLYTALLWFAVPMVAGATIGGVLSFSRGGRVSPEALLEKGKGNYINLLVSVILIALIAFALLLALGLGGIAVYLIAELFSGGTLFSIASVLIFILLGSIAVAILLAMLQFYDSAVVVDSRSPVEAFRASFNFSKVRLGSVVGMSVLKGATALLLAIPSASILFYHLLTSISIPELAIQSFSQSLPRPSFPLAFFALTAEIIFGSLSMCFLYVYEAAYYIREKEYV